MINGIVVITTVASTKLGCLGEQEPLCAEGSFSTSHLRFDASFAVATADDGGRTRRMYRRPWQQYWWRDEVWLV